MANEASEFIVPDTHFVRPWRQAIVWLLCLAPFFFLSYNFANTIAAERYAEGGVGHIVFAWEQQIPFLPWTIIPYWSIDLLYGLSLLVCSTSRELHTLGKRLLSAQVLAVTCFVLFPLHYTFERPESSGIFGELFSALAAFDQPFNQAPSLHITLLVILWAHFPRHLPRLLKWPFHLLCTLIAISVLTTFQHHFIDVPTGALLGWVCLWLWPASGSSPLNTRDTGSSANYHASDLARRVRLIAYYSAGAVITLTVALMVGGWALWLMWGTTSLLLVAWSYSLLSTRGFQKSGDGKHSLAIRWLMWPYLIAARINSRYWTRHTLSANKVIDTASPSTAPSTMQHGSTIQDSKQNLRHIEIWQGRFPSVQDLSAQGYKSVIDMTAEFSKPKSLSADIDWHSIPCLDLLTPTTAQLEQAANAIEMRINKGPILVCCALGYSRSACAVIAWLLRYGGVSQLDSAIAQVKSARPNIVLNDAAIQQLTDFEIRDEQDK